MSDRWQTRFTKEQRDRVGTIYGTLVIAYLTPDGFRSETTIRIGPHHLSAIEKMIDQFVKEQW